MAFEPTPTSARDDSELVRDFLSGEAGALDELVCRHGRPLLGIIRGMVRDPGEAEEVFQEVWYRAIRRLDSFRHGHFRAWLTTIARNLLVDRFRRKRPSVSLDDAGSEEGLPLIERLAGTSPGPPEQAAARELGERIAAGVRRLPAKQREVFLMRTQQSLSFAEIAQLQGVPLNTALGRMHYAVTQLRKELTEP